MRKVRVSTTSIGLAFFVAACGSSQSTTTPTQQGGAGNESTAHAGGGTGSAKGGTSTTGTASGTTTGTTSSGGNTGAGGTVPVTATSGQSTGPGGTASGTTSSRGNTSAGGNTESKGGTTGTTSSAGRSAGASGMGGSTHASTGTSSTGGAAVGGNSGKGGDSAAGGRAAGGTGAVLGGASGATAGGASAGTSGEVSTPPLITSSDGAFWKTTGTLTPVTSGNADVTIGTSGTQSWTGFGGTFNEAGWDALGALSDGDKQLALRLLYDAADGANLAYGRIPIGASDYAMSEYTLDDTANDASMAQFKIDRDLDKLIPFIKAAKVVKPDIRFWASPWTPPPWMKSNNSYDTVSGKTPPYAASDGYMKNDAATMNAFALYLEKFVEAYAAQEITIEAVHPQNEPGYGNPYPSCYWDSATFLTFIKTYLGPLFSQKLPNTQIWAGTMSAPGDGDIATAVAADSTAMQYVKGFGLQWNTSDKVATLKSKGPVMMAEHRCGNYNFNVSNPSGDFTWSQSQYDASKPQNDFAYGIESWKFIRDWIKLGVNSYAAWNMVLDTSGANLNNSSPWHQNALLVVDRTAKTLTKTPAYYVFRHVSQYVGLPATVVSATGGDALGFKNPDGSYTVVIYNKDSARTMIASVGGKKLQFDMPGNGWATIKYKP
jgi:glucosylceramidase